MYVQYTNPANYPPLEHSAHILARNGWEVLFVGVETTGPVQLEMRSHPNITHVRMSLSGPGKYARFLRRVLSIARQYRPHWCYASDHSAAAAALLVRRFSDARVLYHEHDAPGAHQSVLRRLSLSARARLVRSADILVVPSSGRRALLGPGGARALVVWNCPSTDEVVSNAERDSSALRLVYAGSLSADRLPASYVEALARLPRHVGLDIYGYETAGFPDHANHLLETARRLGLADRVRYHGAIPTHAALMREVARAHIGIATLPANADDPNVATMVGASNKPFNYLAAGLPVLVSPTPEWVSTFVDPGYGIACDPASVQSIGDAVTRLSDDQLRSDMVSRGRQRILTDWNYEHQFVPVEERLIA